MEPGMKDEGCRMEDGGCRMEDAGCRMQDAGIRTEDSDAGWRMGREEDEEDGGDNGFGREEAKDQRKGGGHVCTMTLQPPPDLNALWGSWGCEEPTSQIVLAEGPQISLCAPYWLVLIEISQLAQYIIWDFI